MIEKLVTRQLTVRMLTLSPSAVASWLKRRVYFEPTPVSIDGITRITSGLPAKSAMLIFSFLPFVTVNAGAWSPG